MLLYDMTSAMNPRRVRIFLAEKELMIPTRQVDGLNRENLQPEFLSKNSLGIFLFNTYCFAGCSFSISLIFLQLSNKFVSSKIGLKSNFGFGVAGAPPLNLSSKYLECICGSINYEHTP